MFIRSWEHVKEPGGVAPAAVCCGPQQRHPTVLPRAAVGGVRHGGVLRPGAAPALLRVLRPKAEPGGVRKAYARISIALSP